MAESADDPELFWVDPTPPRHPPARRVPRAAPAAPRRAAADFRDPLRHRLRGGHPRLAPRRAKSGRTPGSTTRSCGSTPALFARGAAHSVECWRDGELVGGLYGVSLGAAFFGESMFSRESDASKVALVHLVARLRLGGFRLLDTQFLTPHLARFGAIEITPRALSSAARRGALLPGGLPHRPCPTAPAGGPARRLAIEHVDVIDRVLERRQRRARGEHPAAEHAQIPLARADLVDLEKGGALGRFLGRVLLAVAHPDRRACRTAPGSRPAPRISRPAR